MLRRFFYFCLVLLPLLSQQLRASEEKIFLFVGDSLTAGYGVHEKESYVALLAQDWQQKQKKIRVINTAVSGSTTASCKPRLQWQAKAGFAYLFIALGANDGLRGIAVEASERNLTDCIEFAQKLGAKVFLAGMLLPKNYGEKYRTEFSQMYVRLAKKYKLARLPFLLEGVGGVSELNQADGIHPNAKGHVKMYQQVKKFLEGQL